MYVATNTFIFLLLAFTLVHYSISSDMVNQCIKTMKRKLLITLLTLVLGSAGMYFIIRDKISSDGSFTGNLLNLLGVTKEAEHKNLEVQVVDQSNPFAESEYEQLIEGETPKTKRYVNTAYYFTFEYPTDMKINSFGEDEKSNVILIQDTTADKVNRSFQIYMNPFDEVLAVMTPTRLRRDIPNLVIDNPQEVVLGDSTHALMALSNDPAIGRTREVWIISDGTLYQITAREEADPWIAEVMKSWKFL